MNLNYFVYFTVLALGAADKPVPSVDFSASVDSEIDFSKSADSFKKDAVAYGYDAGEKQNDLVVDSESESFLRNFKNVQNTTDLQALASDVHNSADSSQSASPPQQTEANDRMDNNPRVLRGSGLDHPLFTPFKHNKIDTADFSDCALQGEWRPIGGPAHHDYVTHGESQKEHFHPAAEGPEIISNIAATPPTTHGSLTSEGVAFWNQFIQGGNPSNINSFGPDKMKKFHKQTFSGHHSPHSLKQKLKKFPPKKTPSVPPALQHVNDLDIFQDIRNPNLDYNVIKIQQKPGYNNFGDEPQNIPSDPTAFNDIQFSINPNNVKDSFPPLNSLKESEDYLSPPPMPQLFQSKPEIKKPIQPFGLRNNKYPFKSNKIPHKIRAPIRHPPPVTELGADRDPLSIPPRQYHFEQQQHHQENQHHHEQPHLEHQHYHEQPHLEHQHHHEQPHPEHLHHLEQSNLEHQHHQEQPHHLEHQHQHHHHLKQPGDSSTFTCGHNHAEGTNYHTASYQVEGEADPSIFDEQGKGDNNQFQAPIIFGHPSFQHDDHFEDDANDVFGATSQRLPKSSHPPQDLEEQGTEQGGPTRGDLAREESHPPPYADKQIRQTPIPEEVTIASMLDATAHQKFQTEPYFTEGFYKDNAHDSDTQMPKFQHNEFFLGGNRVTKPSLDLQDTKASIFEQGVGLGDVVSEFYSNQPQFNIQQLQQPPEGPSGSPAGSFFGSMFTSPFIEGSINSNEPTPKHQRRPEKPYSYSEFSFDDFGPKRPSKGKYSNAAIAVFDHTPHNKTKNHIPPAKKRPHKHYEVSENSGEMIPVSAFFPPKKGPRQFNNRTPNLAVPADGKRPPPSPPKYQSTIHFDGSNLDVYQSNPRNKVTKLKLKPKRARLISRYPDSDFRRSLTIMSRIK